MLKFIKVSKTVLNAEDIESVYPSSFRDHNGLTMPRVVIKLKNGNCHKFDVGSNLKVQPMIEDIFNQIMELNGID